MNEYLVITDVEHFHKYKIKADQMVVNEEGAVNFYIKDSGENSHKLIASFSPEHLVAVIQLDNR